MPCIKVARYRRSPHKAIVAPIVARKRKELIEYSAGKNIFVLVAPEMQLDRNKVTKFPSTDGGDIAADFENERGPHIHKALERRPHIHKALKAKMQT